MALPSTVTTEVAKPGFNPPHLSSAGDFYAIATTHAVVAGTLGCFKAADPVGGSWTEQDTGNRPQLGSTDQDFITSVQHGNLIHVCWIAAQSHMYALFNMDADAWIIVGPSTQREDSILNITTDSPDQSWASIAVRGAGDPVVVAYNGAITKVMGGPKERVYFATRDNIDTTGTWSINNTLDSGAAQDVHWGNPNAAKHFDSDIVHFFFQREVSLADPPTTWNSTSARSINTVDNFVGSHLVAGTGDSSARLLGHPGPFLTYDDGGTPRGVVVGSQGGANYIPIMTYTFTAGDAVTAHSEANPTYTGDIPSVVAEVGTVSAVVDGTDLWAVFANGNPDFDLYSVFSDDNFTTIDAAANLERSGTIGFIAAALLDYQFDELEVAFFNTSDSGPTDPDTNWTNDSNAFTQNTAVATDAATGTKTSNELSGVGTNATEIPTQVQVRVNCSLVASTMSYAVQHSAQELANVAIPTNAGLAWSEWVTLTEPTGGWTLAKAQALEIICWSTAGTATEIAEIQARILGAPSSPRKVIAMLYDDAGDVKYDEINIGAAGLIAPGLLHSFAVQRAANY